ncbi:MAG: hypothetical protein RIS70_2805 [Planctomycetota bacterium]|jgi:hypothetical protein
MPDPYRFAMTLAASSAASFFWFWWLGRSGTPSSLTADESSARNVLRSIAAISFAIIVGYGVLRLLPAFPPRSGLDRLLVIVLPCALLLECLGRFPAFTAGRMTLLRSLWALLSMWILLFDSVYLRGVQDEWNHVAAFTTIAFCGVFVAVVWWLVVRIDAAGAGPVVPLSLAMSIMSGGMLVILGGYIKGGSASLPLAGAMLGFGAANCMRATPRPSSPVLSLGVVSLFGIVFVGRFFGRVTTATGITTVLAPLLAGLPILLRIPTQRSRLRFVLAVVLVAIPLTIVVAIAKRDFDIRMAPLLK